jgi:hypothetical protein
MNLKKFALIALPAFISLSLLTTSCKKSNDNNNTSGISGSFGAKAVSVPAGQTTGVEYSGSPYMNIIGAQVSGSDSIGVNLTIDWPATLNKKVSADTDAYAGMVYYLHTTGATNVYSFFYGSGGSFVYTITSVDTVNKKVGGTFSGVIYNNNSASDSVVVTNGKFGTTYTVQ